MPGKAQEEDEPVAIARAVRGRELRTMGIHGRDDPTAGEVYYEGFVDGKRYMVPDSNLEAMKDVINFKMRRRVSLRYKHQTSYDLGEYDHFNQMLKNLLGKFERIDKSISSSQGYSEDTELTLSDTKIEPSDDGIENDKDMRSVPSSFEHDNEEHNKPLEKRTLSNKEDDEKQQVKQDQPEDKPISLEKDENKISELASERTPSNLGEKISKEELYPQKAPPKLHDKEDMAAEINQKNGSLYLGNKKEKSSILDMIDLDKEVLVRASGEKKYPKNGGKTGKSMGEVSNKRPSNLIEDEKTSLHSESKKITTRESEMNKLDEPDLIRPGDKDIIQSKLSTNGRYSSIDETIYLGSKKGRHSMLDIIDLDEVEPVKTYGEGKYSKMVNKMGRPVGEVADKNASRLVEGKKTPIPPMYEERRLTRESEINKPDKPDLSKTGSKDIIPSKLGKTERYSRTDHEMKDLVDYKAEKGRLTLDRMNQTPSQLGSQICGTTDCLDYSTGKGFLVLDSMRETPRITDDKNNTIYLDSKQCRPSILDIIDLDDEEPVKTSGEGKYPKTDSKMGRSVGEVADNRSSSVVVGKKMPMNLVYEERRLSRESEINKLDEPDLLKTGGRDTIPSKLGTTGRYSSPDHEVKDSNGYNAENGRGNTDSLDYSTDKGRLTLDCMRKMLSITDEKNGTNYVDSKKGRHSILDIIDLDEEEPVKTYRERKYSMEGDKIVEGKKMPIFPGFKERRLSQESEISKQIKLDILKTGSIDLIPTKFDTRGQRLSRDYGIENSTDYSAEKRPSTLYNMRKTHQSQLVSEKLELTDLTDNNTKNVSVRLDNEENRPRQFGPEERYPVGEDREKNKTGADITNGSVNGSRLMNPIKADSEKSRFVLKSNQQLIAYDEPFNNDLLNEKEESRIPIKMDGKKKYLQIVDGVGMPLYKVADKRPSSLKEIKSTPMHPEPGERRLTRESETGKSGESYSRKTTPGKDEGRQPSLPPHDGDGGNGDGFKRHEDRGRDEKESEDASISSVEETEEYRVRLLISGHFHPGETPMFIIQEYEADSGVFDDQVVDIKRIQNIGDVNVNIAGKFYKENIIRERDDKSLFLNIKPHTIEVDHQTSKIYYDTFEDSFKIENLVDVVLKGRFIASTITREITPMLSFNIKKLERGGVLSDNSMKNFTKKKPHLNTTRIDQTIEMKGNPYKSQYLKDAVVNIARVANVSFGKVANTVGTSSFDIVEELTISEPSHSNFGSLELTVDDWKPKQSGLYSYLPLVPLSLQKSLTSYKMEIIEVSGENKEIENSPQIKKRSRRRDAKQGEKTKNGGNSTNSENTEYICRIKDYRPAKRKCFNFF